MRSSVLEVHNVLLDSNTPLRVCYSASGVNTCVTPTRMGAYMYELPVLSADVATSNMWIFANWSGVPTSTYFPVIQTLTNKNVTAAVTWSRVFINSLLSQDQTNTPQFNSPNVDANAVSLLETEFAQSVFYLSIGLWQQFPSMGVLTVDHDFQKGDTTQITCSNTRPLQVQVMSPNLMQQRVYRIFAAGCAQYFKPNGNN